jgi:hypothetical protein
LSDANGGGARDFTIDSRCVTGVRDYAQLILWIRSGLNFAKQHTQHHPAKGQWKQCDSQSHPRSHYTKQSEQQDGRDECGGRNPLVTGKHNPGTKPNSSVERGRGGEREPIEAASSHQALPS